METMVAAVEWKQVIAKYSEFQFWDQILCSNVYEVLLIIALEKFEKQKANVQSQFGCSI